jgi:hypothetical protein
MAGSDRAFSIFAVSFGVALLAWALMASPSHGQITPQTRSSDGYNEFVAFNRFIAQSAAAQASDYSGKPGVRVRDAAAFAEMKAHLQTLYRGVQVRHSFVEGGRTVDCVPFNQQPGLQDATAAEKRAAQRGSRPVAPPIPQKGQVAPGATKSLDLTLPPGKHDAFGNSITCERGTIPIRRITLDEMARFPTLGDFLRAGKVDDGSLDRRPQKPPGDTGQHYYARGLQFVDNLGGDAWLNVWSPTVVDHQMSLSQLWVVGSEGDSKQTVEAGWQVDPDKWNSKQSALFIFYTTKNYKDGCYNLECKGFVQVAKNIYLGRGFDHYSARDGGQWGFNLQWKRNTDGNWWLFYKGPGNYIAVGFYPKSLFGQGTLASKATKIAFGGEDSQVPSALEIGSGALAADGWQKAAFQNFIFYIDTSVISQWASLTKQEIVSECYTTDIHNVFGNWGSYLFFGGPKCDKTP